MKVEIEWSNGEKLKFDFSGDFSRVADLLRDNSFEAGWVRKEDGSAWCVLNMKHARSVSLVKEDEEEVSK